MNRVHEDIIGILLIVWVTWGHVSHVNVMVMSKIVTWKKIKLNVFANLVIKEINVNLEVAEEVSNNRD